MQLYLVRHGEAKTDLEDPKRGLTNNGILEVERVAHFIGGIHIAPNELWYSNKLRAKQTAEIFAKALSNKPKLIERPDLRPNDNVVSFQDQLLGMKDDLMIVGHLPFISRLTSLLICDNPEVELVSFPECSTLCLESTERHVWTINWVVNPRVLLKARSS